jgi:hypothetical protein
MQAMRVCRAIEGGVRQPNNTSMAEGTEPVKTTTEVAELLKTDRWQIARYCHRLKIGRRVGTQWLLSDADVAKIQKLRAASAAMAAIEKQALGIVSNHKKGRRTD